MLVGIGSLVLIVYQTYILREQQRASALPYLTIAMTANGEQTYVAVRNSGIGPALIEDVVIHYQGRELEKDPFDFYLDVRPEPSRAGLSVDKLIPGRLISSGEWVLALGTEGDAAPEFVGELLSVFDLGEVPKSWYDEVGVPMSGPDKAIIEIVYTSIYGERWHVRSDRVVPERL